jgi:hypothetical protein
MRIRYIANKLRYWAETNVRFSKIPKYAARRDSFRVYWRENRGTTGSRRERRALALSAWRAQKNPQLMQ